MRTTKITATLPDAVPTEALESGDLTKASGPLLPPLNPPYTNDIARRLLIYIDNKRNTPFTGKLNGGKRFSLRKLAESSGLSYWAIVNYVIRRDRPLSLNAIDNLMYGLGINVTDLLQPHELAPKYDEFSRQVRYQVRRRSSGKSPSTEK